MNNAISTNSDIDYHRHKDSNAVTGEATYAEDQYQYGPQQECVPPFSKVAGAALRGRANTPMRVTLMQSAQRTHGNRAVQREISLSQRSDPSEVEAEDAADKIVAGERVEVRARPHAAISRFGWDDALSMGIGGVIGQVASPFVGEKPPPDPTNQPKPDEGLWDRVKRGWGTEVKQEQRRADEIDKFRHNSIDNTVDWLEAQAHKGSQMGVQATEGIPVLNQIAKANAAVSDFGTEVAGGFIKGAGNFFGSVGQMAANPIGTAKGLWAMSTHIPGLGLPSKILDKGIDVATGDKKLGDAFDETLGSKAGQDDLNFWKGVGGHFLKPYGEAVDKGKYGEVVGRGIFDIGSLVLGAGEAGAAGKAAKGGEATNVAAKVVEGAEGASAASKSIPPSSGVPTLRNPTPAFEPPPGSVPPSKLVPSTPPPAEIPPPVPSQGPPTRPLLPSELPNAPKTVPAGPPSDMPPPPSIPPSTQPAPSHPLSTHPSTVPSPPENLPTTPSPSPGDLGNPVIPPHGEPPGWGQRLLEEERHLERRYSNPDYEWYLQELEKLRRR